MVIICIVPTRRPFNKSSLVYYSSVPGKTIPRSPLSSILILESTLSRGKSAVVLNRSIGSNSPSYIYIYVFDSSSRRLRSRFKGEMYVSSTTYYSFLFLDRYKRRNKYKIFQRFFEDVIERERERGSRVSGKEPLEKGTLSGACHLPSVDWPFREPNLPRGPCLPLPAENSGVCCCSSNVVTREDRGPASKLTRTEYNSNFRVLETAATRF